MRAKTIIVLALAQSAFYMSAVPSRAQSANAYTAMAPLSEYMMPPDAEAAMARTAAPKSISDDADVMVLKSEGYVTVSKGTNGFVCIVERSWAKPTTDAEFWNPKMRAPNCFNQAAADSYLKLSLARTKMVLAGKSREDVLKETTRALDNKTLSGYAPGAMCYMMSKEQYLSDEDKSWHPHVMFYAPANMAKNWGANQPGSPLIAATVDEERMTVIMMKANKWSDGTPAEQPMAH